MTLRIDDLVTNITCLTRFDMDPSWSETGDRYIIKLFRDYVFHQVNENGAPALDMVHVLTCLNKVNIEISIFLIFILHWLFPNIYARTHISSWMSEWTRKLCLCLEMNNHV